MRKVRTRISPSISVLAVVAAACGDDGGDEDGGGGGEPAVPYSEIGESSALELIAWHGYTEDGTTGGTRTTTG